MRRFGTRVVEVLDLVFLRVRCRISRQFPGKVTICDILFLFCLRTRMEIFAMHGYILSVCVVHDGSVCIFLLFWSALGVDSPPISFGSSPGAFDDTLKTKNTFLRSNIHRRESSLQNPMKLSPPEKRSSSHVSERLYPTKKIEALASQRSREKYL